VGVVVVAGARLSLEERLRIEVLWTEGRSVPEIAVRLGRHRSTVWRELGRNNSYRHGPKNPSRRTTSNRAGRPGLYRWGYEAHWADQEARVRARRPRPAACAPGSAVRELVLAGLAQRWSPRQIAARLRSEHPDRPELWVSHETIYQAIYVQSRGNLRAELKDQVALRSGRTRRRRAPAAGGPVRSGRPWLGLNVSQRPAEATDRAVPGHWEGDLVIGAGGASAIVTLVERSTRYVLLGALPDGRHSDAVISVLSRLIGGLPQHLRRSLTWDQGTEMAQHERFAIAHDCPVFFCDPHSPWQRGSNENTNGLLRQYFPKTTFDFRTVDQAHLDAVAIQLNGRPRQTLDWQTPAERLAPLVAPAT
jgi:IS30 family transposase